MRSIVHDRIEHMHSAVNCFGKPKLCVRNNACVCVCANMPVMFRHYPDAITDPGLLSHAPMCGECTIQAVVRGVARDRCVIFRRVPGLLVAFSPHTNSDRSVPCVCVCAKTTIEKITSSRDERVRMRVCSTKRYANICVNVFVNHD